eukprot:6343018-Prymnesium_polylepis.2
MPRAVEENFQIVRARACATLFLCGGTTAAEPNLKMLCPLAIAASARPPRPEVSVSSGALRGVWETDGPVASFRDTPFARAARFEAPQPPSGWSGVRDAGAFGPGCM